jgi:uncharacterized repeat protein (TIGR03803 family)
LLEGSDGNFYGTTEEGGPGGMTGTVFKMTPGGALTTLASFNGANGARPYGGVTQGKDGSFYGTTFKGGSQDAGTIFKVTADGALTTLVSFNGTNGRAPACALTMDSDGNFYGTTSAGGAYNLGTIFKVTPAGQLTTLVSLDGANGNNPSAELVLASDGNFYGTTSGYSDEDGSGPGTLFRLSPDGTFVTLVFFGGSNGWHPSGRLLEGSDGALYGTTDGESGSLYPRYGTVFRFTKAGVFTTLAQLDDEWGTWGTSGLVQDQDGSLYGTLSISGDANERGSVFKLTTAGTRTTLVSFNYTNGAYPAAELVRGSDGSFYGTTSGGGFNHRGTVFKLSPSGEFTTLNTFSAPTGSDPRGPLLIGRDGSFYGTTAFGGAGGSGTLFKLTQAMERTTLASFNSANGRRPTGSLVQDADGGLYGTTNEGGADNKGTVFKYGVDGQVTTLFSFSGANGSGPYGGLILGRDGNLYGTTVAGGSNDHGTIFKMTPSGELTTLISFDGANGSSPYSALVQGRDGNFYGTTYSGGADDTGTIFKVTPGGELTTLFTFAWMEASSPVAGLVEGRDGNFYGTTEHFATGFGSVFKITPEGALTVLCQLNGFPRAGLVEGRDGSFYGADRYAAGFNTGVIFKVTTSGVLTTLHSFDGVLGAGPEGTPIFGSDGKLYGTANQFVVWSLDLGSPRGTLGAVTSITPNSAVLNGSVGTTGNPTARFEYGPTTAYGSGADVSITQGADTIPVSATLSGLSPHTTYHHRLRVTNDLGTVYTADASFSTGNTAPTAPAVTVSATTGDMKTITLPFPTTDPDGDPVTLATVTAGAGLDLNSFSGQTVTFTPRPGFAGASTLSYTLSDGFGGSSTGTVLVAVADNDAPQFSGVPLNATLAATGLDGAVFNYALPTAADPSGVVSLTASHPSGSRFPIGTTTVTFTATDAAGNTATEGFTVTVGLSNPIYATVAAARAAVPGAGADPRIPAGAVWTGFGLPSINDAGQVAFLGQWSSPGGAGTGIFAGSHAAPTLVVKKGDAAAGAVGAVYGALRDPLLAEDGSVVFQASLVNAPGQKAVGAANNEGVWRGTASGLDLLVRKGGAVAGVPGTQWKTFTSVALGGNAMGFTATLASGATRVSGADDAGLWIIELGGGTPRLALRKGQALLGSKVKVIAALTSRPGSLGQGRALTSLTGTDVSVAVRVTLANNLQVVGSADASGAVEFAYRAGETASAFGGAPPARWLGFGLPTQNASGALAFLGAAKPGVGGVTKFNDVAVLAEDDATFAAARLATKGESAPGGSGGRFSGFQDPVNASGGGVAFLGTLAADKAARISGANNLGLWWRRSGSELGLVVRVGSQAPQTATGTLLAGCASLCLPEGGWGPLFVGTLSNQSAALPAGASNRVTASNKTALWGVGQDGTARLLLRTGGTDSAGRVLQGFEVFQAVAGSPGQARSFNARGQVIYRATYKDRSKALGIVQSP